jgi:hypothetical protein
MKNIIFCFLTLILFSNFVYGQLLPPAPPTGVSGAQVGLTRSLKVDWTQATGVGILGYKIYFQEGLNIDSVRVGLVNTDTLNNLNLSTSYTVRLRTFRAGTVLGDTIYSSFTTPIVVQMIELVAPTITVEPQNITQNQAGVRIVDTNISETGFEVEFNGDGQVLKKTLSPGSVIFDNFTNLKPKTPYTIRVRAFRNTFFGPWSNVLSIITKVDLPPVATLRNNGDCPTVINLAWTVNSRPEDIEEFILARSFDGVNFNNFANLTPDFRNFPDLDAQPGKAHIYRITTVNSTGVTQSPFFTINAKSFVAPNPAINLISDQSDKSRNHVTIRWTNGTEDLNCRTNIRDEIVIHYRLNNSTEYIEYKRLFPFESSIKVEGLKPKDIVTVRVLSVSDKGIPSLPSFITDTTAGPPYAPSDLIIIAAKDAIDNNFFELRWKDNSRDEDYFIVEKSRDNVNFNQIAKFKFDITSFRDLAIEEGVIYYYRIKAGSNTEGESAYTSPVFGIYDYTKAPNAPYGLRVNVNGNSVALRWYDDSSREENYIIEKSTDSENNFIVVATLGRNVVNYVDQNVLAGKTYYYRAKAINPRGESSYSNIEKVSIAPSATVLDLNTIGINIYPNPTIDFVKIKNPVEINGIETTVRVFDKNNREVFRKAYKLNSDNDLEIELPQNQSGMFTVQITAENSAITKKIFKY